MANAVAANAPLPYQCVQVMAPSPDPKFEIHHGQLPPPARGEVTVQVAAASVNPIDVKRAQGHGQRLLRFKGVARFPLTLGNDFAGHIVAVGADVGDLQVGEPVFGLLPMGPLGAHANLVNARASYLRRVGSVAAAGAWHALCTLPYTYTTMRLALQGAGLSPESAHGRSVLLHGASGGLGRLALQKLVAWGARVSAICGAESAADCRALGAREVVVRTSAAWRQSVDVFDATLNFADWSDEAWLLSRLKPGALGHASTVHPLLHNFDRLGWLGGAWQTRCDRAAMSRAAAVTAGSQCRYAWTVFKPVPAYLDDLQSDIDTLGLRLPVGLEVTMDEVKKAFDYTRQGGKGRAVLWCAGNAAIHAAAVSNRSSSGSTS